MFSNGGKSPRFIVAWDVYSSRHYLSSTILGLGKQHFWDRGVMTQTKTYCQRDETRL